jgi:hypothetical protein
MLDSHPRAFEMKLFAPTGDLAALCVVSKNIWPGVGVAFNRENFKDVVKRPEFNKTGVYVLIGESEDDGSPIIYVGEGDPVKDRLNRHYAERDFWQDAVFFVAKDDSLNKAHVQYLESRLYELAKNANRCKLVNEKKPQPPTLAEAEIALVVHFLHQVLSIFPLLGVYVFEKSEMARKPDERSNTTKSKPTKATGAPPLRLPQARVLQALLPVAGERPSMSRAELCKEAGFTPTTGTVNRAMYGIREGGGSGTPHKGLLGLGLATMVKRQADNETTYRITTEGVRAIEGYLKEHGELPKPRDKALCVNIRYKT